MQVNCGLRGNDQEMMPGYGSRQILVVRFVSVGPIANK